MDITGIALQGLQKADAQLQSAATKIANLGATSANRDNLDTVDLSKEKEMVALISAKTDFSANLKTMQTADEVQKDAIDITA